MKPHVHADNSVKQFGGKPADYIEIHKLLDSSKGVIADHRHRALTHNTWFISTVLERVFGYSITNSDGKEVSVRDIGEQHVLEDFRGKFIPSGQDWLDAMEYQGWMNNGATERPKPGVIAKTQLQEALEKLERERFPGTSPRPGEAPPWPTNPFDRGQTID